MHRVENLHITGNHQLITPQELKKLIPMTEKHQDKIYSYRETVQNIFRGTDARLLVIVGPCSIHDPHAAREYAKRLKSLADSVADKLYIVMRVYFEKPRTTVGWKGLINDPYLNDGFAIQDGLSIARQLMYDITEIGLPIATEALDPISPQYLHDYVSWTAIGARTTESQTHREMASGLSSPVGFKNSTDGNIMTAIHAIMSAAKPHRFLGINEDGRVSVVETDGNMDGHIILRGGSDGPNYDAIHIHNAVQLLEKNALATNIVVDCSHGNSLKKYQNQPVVAMDVIQQIRQGNHHIKGIMIESNLVDGQQTLVPNQPLVYGQSITDGCIGWETTEMFMQKIAEQLV